MNKFQFTESAWHPSAPDSVHSSGFNYLDGPVKGLDNILIRSLQNTVNTMYIDWIDKNIVLVR